MLALFNAADLASLSSSIVMVTSVVVGGLVASRRPRNAVGWIFCAIGLSASTFVFALRYGRYALLAHPGSLPVAEAIARATNWADKLVLGLAVFLFLFFPDGRLLSRCWRSVLCAAIDCWAALEPRSWVL